MNTTQSFKITTDIIDDSSVVTESLTVPIVDLDSARASVGNLAYSNGDFYGYTNVGWTRLTDSVSSGFMAYSTTPIVFTGAGSANIPFGPAVTPGYTSPGYNAVDTFLVQVSGVYLINTRVNFGVTNGSVELYVQVGNTALADSSFTRTGVSSDLYTYTNTVNLISGALISVRETASGGSVEVTVNARSFSVKLL